MIKRLLSYFVPINIFKTQSTVSRTLEVTWNNGQLVLDSQNTNYSYGSLQRVLRKGLIKIGFDRVREMNHILVLGVGGGSVIKTLVDEVKFTGRITGVDIDQQVIDLADQYFRLSSIPNLEVIVDDAFDYVLKTKNKHDLIIVDIFKDTEMPSFVFESFFSERIGFLLNPGGYIMFNTMTLSEADEDRNREYKKHFDPVKFKLMCLHKLEEHNELIIVHKNVDDAPQG